MAQSDGVPIFAGRHRMLLWIMLMAMLVAGLWLRLYHITEPPFDFHSQRQYWDANRARLMYYQSLESTMNAVPRWQMEIARANADISTEPPIIESLAVAAYHVAGGENLALPRGISSALYVIGGLFLFLLAVRLFSPLPAFVALGYYLFLPFAVQSTRTFQPDPLMTASVCAGLYFLYRYVEQQTLARLLTAAPFVALALLAKPISIFFTVVPFAALLLGKFIGEKDWKQRRRVFPLGHVAIFTGVVLLGLAWTLWSMAKGGGVAQQAAKTFIPALFGNPAWWEAYWQGIWEENLMYWALTGGLLGILCELIRWILGLFYNKPRPIFLFLLGGWIGYVAYFYFFNYHVQSHVYYNLPMVPILALSLAALFSAAVALVTAKFKQLPTLAPAIFGVVFASVLIFSIVKTAGSQVHPDFAQLQQIYEEIGDRVGHTRKAAFLTYGYGDPLKYHGMVSGGWWPTQADFMAEQMRGEPPKTTVVRLRRHQDAGHEAFIIDPTMFEEFNRQPELEKLLAETYPVIYQPPDFPYLIFDLRYPLKPLPER